METRAADAPAARGNALGIVLREARLPAGDGHRRNRQRGRAPPIEGGLAA
jgi:hypothetical protein